MSTTSLSPAVSTPTTHVSNAGMNIQKSAQTQDVSPSTIFHQFARLDTALQCMIWKTSIPSRFVEVESAGRGKGWKSKCAPPVVLQVCHQSREEAKRSGLRLRFASEKDGVAQEARIYFDFERDALFIGWDAFFIPGHPETPPLKWRDRSSYLPLFGREAYRTNIGEIEKDDLIRVQNLAIESYLPWNIREVWHVCKEEKLWNGLSAFSGRRNLILVASQLLFRQRSLYTNTNYKSAVILYRDHEHREEPTVAHLEDHLAQHAKALEQWSAEEQQLKGSSESIYSVPICTKILPLCMRPYWWSTKAKEDWLTELKIVAPLCYPKCSELFSGLESYAPTLKLLSRSTDVDHRQFFQEWSKIQKTNENFEWQARKSDRSSCERTRILSKHIHDIAQKERYAALDALHQLNLDWGTEYMDKMKVLRSDLYMQKLVTYGTAIKDSPEALAEKIRETSIKLHKCRGVPHAWRDDRIPKLLSDTTGLSYDQLHAVEHLAFDELDKGEIDKPAELYNDWITSPRFALKYLKAVEAVQSCHASHHQRTLEDMKKEYVQLESYSKQSRRQNAEYYVQLEGIFQRLSSFEDAYLDEKRGLPLHEADRATVVKDWQDWKSHKGLAE